MRAVDIITKKRDHEELSSEEIDFFIQGYTNGDIPDYQASAFAMAVLLNGMTDRESTDLTMSMARSGEILDLSDIVPTIIVDKHSTGGVGDKVTLVIAPLVSSCGLPVGKMSGRGLGFSGGTLDKMETIPGYRVDLSSEEFAKQLSTIGIVLTGQSANLAPADGKLYAMRDVTGTVQSMPLIASSVMSKKLAGGANAIVLDVKIGLGAFMETEKDARQLSELMVAIGKMSDRQMVALLSDMNQPLGYGIGNSLELIDAIETLQGRGPADFREHCLVVASHMLVLGKKAGTLEDARVVLEKAIDDGSAWEQFRKLVIAQQGDVSYIDNPEKLPKASYIETVNTPRSGYLHTINARIVGETAVLLGAGRAKKSDTIDHAVGIVVHHKVGDQVEEGAPLFTIHANDPDQLSEASKLLLEAHIIDDSPCSPLPLFYGVIQ
jgi:pyrimidine-nucleoside phosphorylase